MTDCAETVAAIESAIGRTLTPEERLQAGNGGAPDLLETLSVDRVKIPGKGAIERRGMFFGYELEKVSTEPGKVAYLLHGPKVTYRLWRNVHRPHQLYATNSKGNVCNIKGNYHFIEDADGRLRVAI